MTVIGIDVEKDQIMLYGVRYALSLFRTLAVGPIGSKFEIAERQDGVVILRQLPPIEGQSHDQ